MRLDLYLKVSRLINRRSKAKEMCDKGLIKVNGKISKPSHAVKVGDLIEIDFLNKFLKVMVLEIPQGKNVSKRESSLLYKVVEKKKRDLFIGDIDE